MSYSLLPSFSYSKHGCEFWGFFSWFGRLIGAADVGGVTEDQEK